MIMDGDGEDIIPTTPIILTTAKDTMEVIIVRMDIIMDDKSIQAGEAVLRTQSLTVAVAVC
jgi:hypothetical protein